MAKRELSRAESRDMFNKIEAQKAANRQAEIDAAAHRLTDPVEQAKTYLRRRGWTVFDGYVVGRIGIMVGTMCLAPAEVIAMAAKDREQRAAA